MDPAPLTGVARASTRTRWLAFMWATTVVSASVAALPPVQPHVVNELALVMEPRPATVAEAADILGTNLRVSLVLVALGFLGANVGSLHLVCRSAVGCILGLNALLVGAAVGSYGIGTLTWLPHLPLEWAALSMAASRAGCLRHARWLGLLLLACIVEVGLTPQSG